ncbi:MAG: hypothetical protein EHM58_19390 [Ignavibacteriae bacterium]|nr:MAG: hypothetical protein EHM58_19390 [Ignavibacteriota bacterium]
MSEKLTQINKNIEAILKKKDWTMYRLAKELELPYSNLHNRFTGKAKWTIDELFTLAELLRTDIMNLIIGETGKEKLINDLRKENEALKQENEDLKKYKTAIENLKNIK